jgi:DNA-binding transcriptional LysR family regulator
MHGAGVACWALQARPSTSWQVAHFLADGRLRVCEAYQRPPMPLSILTLRNRLRLRKVRAFLDFLQRLDASATTSLEFQVEFTTTVAFAAGDLCHQLRQGAV